VSSCCSKNVAGDGFMHQSAPCVLRSDLPKASPLHPPFPGRPNATPTTPPPQTHLVEVVHRAHGERLDGAAPLECLDEAVDADVGAGLQLGAALGHDLGGGFEGGVCLVRVMERGAAAPSTPSAESRREARARGCWAPLTPPFPATTPAAAQPNPRHPVQNYRNHPPPKLTSSVSA
jgi:hypothetical protein